MYLSIDIETYSSKDLTKCGVYAYAEDEAFEILLFGYAFDDEEVKVVDLKCGEKLPGKVMAALTDCTVIKTAFNANFERTCLATYFKRPMASEQWNCTAALALELGLPGNLEGAARSLKLEEQKLAEGKALLRFFSMPCKDLKGRNLPEEHADKWKLFKDYCKRDVEVERSIRKRLDSFGITKLEQRLWCLDQSINDRGVKVHKSLISKAIACDIKYKESLSKEALKLLGSLNLKSAAQVKKWLLEKEDMSVDTLSKESVKVLIDMVSSEEAKLALRLRQELSKTSIKKYEAMERAICSDDRLRGLFQFYGANRTGRWAGRLVHVQNLPQNKLKDLATARDLLIGGHYEELDLLYESVPEVLSQLIRTMFIPEEGSRFIVADFSAIEARVIAYLAGEKWRMEVFNSHGKIYEASAAQMFRVPMASITKDSPLRQKGKIAELALGYQGSVGALTAMGALKMGLDKEELKELVAAWRNSNQNIVRFWADVEKAAFNSVKNKTVVNIQKGISFETYAGVLFIKLPSGRKLSYVRPNLEVQGSYNKQVITYEGVEQGTKQWGRLATYGGKLVENIVQAVARDCLALAMLRLDEAGYKIVGHVHDEVILEVPDGFGSIEEVQEIMAQFIDWAKGLPLRAEAFETQYYRK